jgi:hypothetical protein
MEAHAGIPLAAHYTTNSFPAAKIIRDHFQGSNSSLNLPSYKTMYMTLM